MKAKRGSPEWKANISRAKIGHGVGETNPHWKGGSFISDGYRYVYAPSHPNCTKDGYVLEHRLVMEEALGRRLEPTEAVHHGPDHDKLNNRPGNLQLCESNGRHSVAYHIFRNEKGQFACG